MFTIFYGQEKLMGNVKLFIGLGKRKYFLLTILKCFNWK